MSASRVWAIESATFASITGVHESVPAPRSPRRAALRHGGGTLPQLRGAGRRAADIEIVEVPPLVLRARVRVEPEPDHDVRSRVARQVEILREPRAAASRV